MAYVKGTNGNEAVNAAIVIPKALFADDGRVFKIRDWNANSRLTENVEITATMFVEVERHQEERIER